MKTVMDKQSLNILVTGAYGQLGNSVKKAAHKSTDRYFFTDVDSLDITDHAAVNDFVVKNNINVIVNCAAYTNVDAAEDNYEVAELLNGRAPGILAEIMKENNGTLIHISTDYVFGGDLVNTPVDENCPTNPTGVYGLTKLHGENEIKDSGASAIIIRTSWLYSEFGANFVKKIISLLQARDSIKVVFDQCGTPTYAGELAETIVTVISNRKLKGFEGIYHFSNEGVCSWFDFASAICNLSEFKDKEILPCHSNEFPSKVTRPPYSVMDKTKIKETFNVKIPHWHDSLRVCMRNMASE